MRFRFGSAMDFEMNKTPTREKKATRQATISFETFQPVNSYRQGMLTQSEPWCFNGGLGIKKYRITVEEIAEDDSVLIDRLKKLWRECDNHHHWVILRSAAQQLGVELPFSDLPKK
jgi:hypothetical protein